MKVPGHIFGDVNLSGAIRFDDEEGNFLFLFRPSSNFRMK
jgi:hypothetical protein